jgi:hypothetical protein
VRPMLISRLNGAKCVKLSKLVRCLFLKVLFYILA